MTTLYTLSSTDPEHYNRVRVNLPVNYIGNFINICITGLTCNCNIQVLEESDYITFEFESVQRRIQMKPCSDITTDSLSYELQGIFDSADVPVTAALMSLRTLTLSSKAPFKITDMSYNVRLLTGWYCSKDEDFPLCSTEYSEETTVSFGEDKDLTGFSLDDLNVRVDAVAQLNTALMPPDACGFNIQFKSSDETIAMVNSYGIVNGLIVGSVTISAEVRNPGTLITSAHDFQAKSSDRVGDGERVKIESVTLSISVSMYIGTSKTLYPTVKPVAAYGYLDEWTTDNPAIASVTGGIITACLQGRRM